MNRLKKYFFKIFGVVLPNKEILIFMRLCHVMPRHDDFRYTKDPRPVHAVQIAVGLQSRSSRSYEHRIYFPGKNIINFAIIRHVQKLTTIFLWQTNISLYHFLNL